MRYDETPSSRGQGTMTAATHTDTTLDGLAPDTDVELTLSDDKRERGLKYVSKSRIKTYLNCPFKFYLKYWCEHRPDGTIHTERGSQVHEAFEIFHENAMRYLADEGRLPDQWTALLPDEYELWSQWLEPFIGNFWTFEERRLDQSHHEVSMADAMIPRGIPDFDKQVWDTWKPIGVETEFWLGEPPSDYDRADPDYVSYDGPPVGDIPWMGKADLIVHTSSVPYVDGSGVVIIDYKTGTAPSIKYDKDAPFFDEMMNTGVFLETEYYGWLAEQQPEFDYEIDAVAAYYPKNDKLTVGEYPSTERRFDIKRAAIGMQKEPEFGENPQRAHENAPGEPENFGRDEGNLCHYGHGGCYFYNVCASNQGE